MLAVNPNADLDAFISYSHSDVELARRLLYDLKRYGIRIWLDLDRIEPGAYLPAEVETALQSCRYFLLILSVSALKSRWVNLELQTAISLEMKTGKPVIVPLVTDQSEMPPMLAARSYLSFRSETGYSISLDKLVERIRGGPDRQQRPHITDEVETRLPAWDLIFDEGHGQERWDLANRPLPNLDYRLFTEAAAERGYRIVSTNQRLTLQNLQKARGLVLIAPHHSSYSDREMRDIQAFVRTGGSVLALSYYFSDRHHRSNLSEIVSEFGVELRGDRVWDPYRSTGTALHIISEVTSENPLVPIGTLIHTPLTCSLRTTAPAMPFLVSGPESTAETPDVVVDGIARSFNLTGSGSQVVGALSTYGLGRVLVLGSWEVFTIRCLQQQGCQNSLLLCRALSWLGEERPQ